MKEKQLFPCDTTHLARMMLREDDGDLLYVIQSEYNKRTKMFENELIVSVGSPTAELEAWNAYIGTLDTAVNKILRERPELKAYFAELARSTTGTAPPAISKIKQTLDNIFHTITTFFRIR